MSHPGFSQTNFWSPTQALGMSSFTKLGISLVSLVNLPKNGIPRFCLFIKKTNVTTSYQPIPNAKD